MTLFAGMLTVSTYFKFLLATCPWQVVVLDSGCQSLQDGLKALAKALTRGHVGKSIQVGSSCTCSSGINRCTSQTKLNHTYYISTKCVGYGFIKAVAQMKFI